MKRNPYSARQPPVNPLPSSDRPMNSQLCKGLSTWELIFGFGTRKTPEGEFTLGLRRLYVDESTKLETNGGLRYVPASSDLRTAKIDNIAIDTLKTSTLIILARENGGLPAHFLERDDLVRHVEGFVSVVVDLAPRPSDTTCSTVSAT